MKTKKRDVHWMVSVALMAAMILILVITPLGTINLPTIKATIGHIPVIIGAIVLGPTAGGLLGGFFGICMLLKNTFDPSSLLSFTLSPFIYATSPFVKNPTVLGGLGTIWISVGCRILIGLVSGWIWILFKKLGMVKKLQQTLAIGITACIGSMVNTITVMGSIYLLFAQQYALAKDVPLSSVWGLVMGTVIASGIPEAIIATILVTSISKILLKISVTNDK